MPDAGREARGLATLKRIAGDHTNQPLSDWSNIAPDMRRFIVEFVAGEVLSRPGLDLKSRQLATVAMLIAKGDAPDEFRMHLAGALRLGWKKEELAELMLQAAPFSSFPNALNALKWSQEVFSQSDEGALSPAEQVVHAVFAADAALDVEAFLNVLTPDAQFRMGSQPELTGRDAIRPVVQALFDSVRSLKHQMIELWVSGDRVALRGEVTITLKDGTTSLAPYMNSLLMTENGLVSDYRIHIDMSLLKSKVNRSEARLRFS
jgi:4-carboxymuconolactone decarboxylase